MFKIDGKKNRHFASSWAYRNAHERRKREWNGGCEPLIESEK